MVSEWTAMTSSTLESYKDWPPVIATHPNQLMLFVADPKKSLHQWVFSEGTGYQWMLESTNTCLGSKVTYAFFSKDGELFATLHKRSISIWTMDDGLRKIQLIGMPCQEIPNSACFIDSGRYLAVNTDTALFLYSLWDQTGITFLNIDLECLSGLDV